MKILIVDDCECFRFMLTDLVNNLLDNPEIVTAEDGAAGLKALESFAPDVVFTDFNMPNMNGLFFASTVKQCPLTKHIPFVMISARDFKHELFRSHIVKGSQGFRESLIREITQL